MKYLVVSLIVVFGWTMGHAQDKVNYFQGSVQASVEQAEKEGKYVLVKGFTSWCGYCKKLDRETFSDSSVSELLNKRFVVLNLDMETKEGQGFGKVHGITGYPTMVVLDKEGKAVKKYIGYRDAPTFKAELERFVE